MEDKIKSWLIKTGYPLELFVQKIVLSEGYMCEKSPIYSDVETEVAREIDLTAYKHGTSTDKYSYDLQLIFECKKSEKPLIILCGDEAPSMRFEQLLASDVYDDNSPLAELFAYIHLHEMPDEELNNRIEKFSEKCYSGYSIVTAFSKSDENIYKGMMGLAKADEFYRKEYYDIFHYSRNDNQSDLTDKNYFQMRVSILVVDSPLYLANISNEGETQINETKWASVKMNLPWLINTKERGRTCKIQVVKKEGLQEFLKSISILHNYISQEKIIYKALVE